MSFVYSEIKQVWLIDWLYIKYGKENFFKNNWSNQLSTESWTFEVDFAARCTKSIVLVDKKNDFPVSSQRFFELIHMSWCIYR